MGVFMYSRRDLFLKLFGTMAATGVTPLFAGPGREYRRGGMVYRRLGQTDLFPSLLAFGSHTDFAYRVRAGSGTVLSMEGQKRRDRQLAHAIDLGINTLDVYEDEGQWEPVEQLTRGRRGKVIISLRWKEHEYIGNTIDRGAKLFGYVDMIRIYVNDFERVDDALLEAWDALRKAKEAGKVRAIGVSSHNEQALMPALGELEGLDYVLFPYNFIHARADFMEFLPAAQAKGIGLIAIKPLAMGSITNMDPRAHSGPKPESESVVMLGSRKMVMLPAAVAELTRTLNRLPDETLCQAAMRFVFSRPFLSAVFTGMWDDQWIQDNYAALQRSGALSSTEEAALKEVSTIAQSHSLIWLPPSYRWLEERWQQ